MLGMMLDSCLLEKYGDCLISLLTLEENVAGVGRTLRSLNKSIKFRTALS